MLARGIRIKKTAKFNSLSAIKTVALVSSVAVLASACSSSGDKKDDATFGFEEQTDAVDTAPAVVAEPVPVAEASAEPEPEPAPEPKVIKIRDTAPERYVVKRGDTLWDISKLYLESPWLWPELWYFNPQIANPHLIYPGDTLIMSYIGGRPQLSVARGEQPSIQGDIISDATDGNYPAPDKVVKIKPRIRRESLQEAIPTIPLNAIQAFLNSSRVLTKDQLEELPSIVGSLDNHLVSGINHTVYADKVEDSNNLRYEILRTGRTFLHPETGELLGYEALEIGEAKLVKHNAEGSLSTFLISKSTREVLNGDLLVPADASQTSFNFIPHQPEVEVDGQVIALHNAISNVATNEVVIINLGQRDGLEVGNVLAIDQAGAIVRQRLPGTVRSKEIQLPQVRAGLALVFRTFDRVSYALIVDSSRAIHTGDKVRNPEIATDL